MTALRYFVAFKLLLLALSLISESRASDWSATNSPRLDSNSATLDIASSKKNDEGKFLAMEKRNVDDETNNPNITNFCDDYYDTYLIQTLNATCLQSISNLNVASPRYIVTERAEQDIDTVCKEDCAGAILDFSHVCPDYLPHFPAYLRGICSINVNHMERCAFSVAKNNGSKVYQKCFVETNAFERCRPRCKNALGELSSDLGCCVNTFYNDTYYFFSGLRYRWPHLNYSVNTLLWEQCGIQYPNECPLELFSFPDISTTTSSSVLLPTPSVPPPTVTLCSGGGGLEESCFALLAEFQTPEGLQNVSSDTNNARKLCSATCAGNYVKQCKNVRDDTSTLLELFCGEYDGTLCGGVVVDSHSILLKTTAACNLSHYHSQREGSSFTCSPACRAALIDIELQLGCCAYALTLGLVSQRVGTVLLDEQLWLSCALDPPIQCPNPFQEDLHQNTASTSSRPWVAGMLAAFILLVSLGITVMIVLVTRKKRQQYRDAKCPPVETTTITTDDMDFNHSYSRVEIQTPTPPNTGNSYSTVALKPKDFTASSESLLEILDNAQHSFRPISQPRTQDRATAQPRQGGEREWGESDKREREGVREELEEDDRGFQYMTTANIARHLRSNHNGGGALMYGNVSVPESTVSGVQSATATNRTVIYQEPHCPPKPAFYDAGSPSTGSPQYHYVRSENNPLYPRTDNPLLTASSADSIIGSEEYIKTERNISYITGNTATAQDTCNHAPQSATLPPTRSVPLHKQRQKPAIKPRRKFGGKERGGDVEVMMNASYGITDTTADIGRNLTASCRTQNSSLLAKDALLHSHP